MADILEIVAPKRRALAAAKRLVHLRDEAVQDENMRAVILHAAEVVAKSGVLSTVAESGQKRQGFATSDLPSLHPDRHRLN
ncbi:MAG TPA: hypothetical protein DD939_07015 [Sulfitobacter pontiacus]|nr:hypothetical protein [Sulfitobacter pontiacus]|tara:strand:- start:1134 stop:1376 length:243 start_codon:yes stop_codon:yes gene_type:complete